MSSVTAIIPTYNRADYLDKAITSVLQQTDAVAELIVVDDGSKDDTKELVNAYQQTNIKIIYIYQENKGPAAARNNGIKNSACEFIAFLDSDDIWHKRKIELQLKQLKKNSEFLISHTSERWMRQGKHLNRKKKHLQKHGDIFFQNLKLCAAGMSTVMVRKKIFNIYGLFDEDLLCCEDYEFWLRIGEKENFLLIDAPLTVKNGGRDDQVSSIYRQGMDTFRINALGKLIKKQLVTAKKYLALVEECERRCLIYAKGCEKHGRMGEAELYHQKLHWLKTLKQV